MLGVDEDTDAIAELCAGLRAAHPAERGRLSDQLADALDQFCAAQELPMAVGQQFIPRQRHAHRAQKAPRTPLAKRWLWPVPGSSSRPSAVSRPWRRHHGSLIP